jgi:hypothetical protein
MSGPGQAPARRGWWLIDGLPHDLLVQAMRRAPDRLPALAALCRQGRLAALRPLAPNCQTPASLAALYSGQDAGATGICGFDLPDFAAGPLGLRRAFDTELPLRGSARMVWDTPEPYRKPVLLHMPFVSAASRRGARRVFDGFARPRLAPAVWSVEEARARLLALPQDNGWVSVPLRDGTPCRAASALIGGQEKILFLGVWAEPTFAGVPFRASGLQHFYRNGALGPRVIEGGDGTAERLFMGSLRQMAAYFNALWLHHWAGEPYCDIFGYQPALDLALHELAGMVDPSCAHFSPRAAVLIWPLLIDLLADFDRVIALTRQNCGPQDRVIVCSDHGMMPVDLLVRPNILLEQMGILRRDAGGQIDPGASKAWLHPAENGLICLRDEADPGLGTELARRLTAETGRRARVEVYPVLEPHLAPPTGLKARHFLWAGERVQIRADLEGPLCQPSAKTGEHVVAGEHPALRGVVLDLSPAPGFDGPGEVFAPWEVAGLLDRVPA